MLEQLSLLIFSHMDHADELMFLALITLASTYTYQHIIILNKKEKKKEKEMA